MHRNPQMAKKALSSNFIPYTVAEGFKALINNQYKSIHTGLGFTEWHKVQEPDHMEQDSEIFFL